MSPRLCKFKLGFTLAELLVALAILGVIATFTIPKVLNGMQDSRSNAIAKEAAASISAAYQLYKLDNTVTSSFTLANLIPYLNYVKQAPVNLAIDDVESGTFSNCMAVASYPCYQLHNGAMIKISTATTFNGTTSLNAVPFFIDPDGRYGNSTTGPSKSVLFYLYYDGKIRTVGTIQPNTVNSVGTYSPKPQFDPSWFSWN
jgi:prepilin-type N-terminal cleavage/methylation domain-containing protein